MALHDKLIALYHHPELLDEFVAPSAADAASRQLSQFQVRILIDSDEDQLRFDLAYFRLDGEQAYTLDRYKAVLYPTFTVPDLTVNHVNTLALERQMAAIDWNMFPTRDEASQAAPLNDIVQPDTAAGRIAQEAGIITDIHNIHDDLMRLAQTSEGLMASVSLQARYFSQMPFMTGSAHQKQLDTFEEIHGIQLVFGNHPLPAPSFYEATQMLKGQLPAPPPYQPHIHSVSIEEVPLSFFKDPESARQPGDYQHLHFRSFDKAFAHASTIDDRQFFPNLMQAAGRPTVIRHVTLSQEFSGFPIASKMILGGDLNDGSATLGWRVHKKYYSAQRFFDQINRPAGSLQHYHNDPSTIVLATETDLQQGAQQAAQSKGPMRKQQGRGNNHRLN